MSQPPAPRSCPGIAQTAAHPASGKARVGPGRWSWPLLLAMALGCMVTCWWVWEPSSSVGHFQQLQQWQVELARLHASYPLGLAAAYVAVFTGLTALCLPGCGVLLLLGGATFGLVWGSVLSLVASTAGATFTMLAARHALRPWVASRFGPQLARFQAATSQDGGRSGAQYLLSLRLLPVIPFVPVNLMAGLTGLRTRTFFAVSLVGMLPGTAVYVHAGQALSQVGSLDELWSPSAMGAVALLGVLGVLPLVWRWQAGRAKRLTGPERS